MKLSLIFHSLMNVLCTISVGYVAFDLPFWYVTLMTYSRQTSRINFCCLCASSIPLFVPIIDLKMMEIWIWGWLSSTQGIATPVRLLHLRMNAFIIYIIQGVGFYFWNSQLLFISVIVGDVFCLAFSVFIYLVRIIQ